MTPGSILLATTGWDAAEWVKEFRRLAPERPMLTRLENATDPAVRYALVWKHPHGMLAKLPNLQAIFSLGAGVDHVFTDPQLPDVPVVRIVADDLTQRMSEYVIWQVLEHLRHGRIYRHQQAEKIWREPPQPASSAVTVGIMGLGVLGRDAASKLRHIGFKVAGWGRRSQQVDGVACHHGEDGLATFLGQSDIVVVLLPLTQQTRGIVNRDLISKMKRKTPLGGPVLINAGRGGLQVEADILAALDDGSLMAASLDVFETEPLPKESPLWSHPSVTVTPHAAAASDPAQLAPLMLAQIRAHERGEPLANLANRDAGY